MTTISTMFSGLVRTFLLAWDYRRAWWFTATCRTRSRFVRTTLGSFWLGLSNLFSIAVLAVVYGAVFKVPDFNTYVVYLGLGLSVWNTLSASISSAPTLFEHNSSQLHNTNLHPIFFTLEEWSFQIQTFFQSFSLVLLCLSFFQPSLIINFVLYSWIPLLNFLIFIYWFPTIVCFAGAKYRDLYQLVPIALQLIFLLSPILYNKDNLGIMAWTADINPLYRILSLLRHSLMVGELNLSQNMLVFSLNIVFLLISVALINKNRYKLPFYV